MVRPASDVIVFHRHVLRSCWAANVRFRFLQAGCFFYCGTGHTPMRSIRTNLQGCFRVARPLCRLTMSMYPSRSMRWLGIWVTSPHFVQACFLYAVCVSCSAAQEHRLIWPPTCLIPAGMIAFLTRQTLSLISTAMGPQMARSAASPQTSYTSNFIHSRFHMRARVGLSFCFRIVERRHHQRIRRRSFGASSPSSIRPLVAAESDMYSLLFLSRKWGRSPTALHPLRVVEV